ncbi:MAG: Holliday junction branch migration protein RuvA [Bacillota bacterium]
MLAFLRGQILAKANNYLILEVDNVGYQVFAGESLLSSCKSGETIELYLSHQVREDASDLYGFRNLDDLELFNLLLSVSGVGPKSALGVLSLATADDVREAVMRGDASLLTKVSGIGKKTAERIVLELKGKIARLSAGGIALPGQPSSSYGDELDAMMSLGYSLGDAKVALGEVGREVEGSAERVKAALRLMRKK